MSYNLTVNSSGLNGYVDPVAQSFLIERPLFITKIGVYFSTKDTKLPVTLTVRSNENGQPTQNVIAGSTVVKNYNEVDTSTNAANVTYFTFNSPLFLDTGEYSFILSSDSNKYRVWISEFGTTDISTNSVISKQPYAGTMYRSQNGYTWEANQLQDIKFDLYRAKFTSTSATVDLTLDKTLVGNAKFFLKTTEMRSYRGCSSIKVTAPNHGLENGYTVLIGDMAGDMDRTMNANVVVSINGIPFDDIVGQSFTVSDTRRDTFFITLSNAASFSGITAGAFRSSPLISTVLPYSGYYSALGKLIPPKTSINNLIKTVAGTTSPSLSSFEAISNDTIEFTEKKVLLNDYNRSSLLSNAESFIHRIELSTEDDYLSPVIDLPFASGTFIINDINSPSISDNYTLDNSNVAIANTLISFSNTSIIFGGSNERANVKTLVPGTFITASNTLYNNATYRVVSVETNGNSIIIAQSGNTTPFAYAEPVGRAVTVTYAPGFVAEEAASKSSSRAKYFTRNIELQNPSTGLVLRMAVCKPGNSDVEVYYKTRASGEVSTFKNKEFTKLNLGVVKNTLANQFVDVEKVVDNLTQFTAVTFKVVLKSTNIATVPKVKDLRIIALE